MKFRGPLKFHYRIHWRGQERRQLAKRPGYLQPPSLRFERQKDSHNQAPQ